MAAFAHALEYVHALVIIIIERCIDSVETMDDVYMRRVEIIKQINN